MINRDKYLKQLIDSKQNGFPKVITGIRRCGKSYTLETIYKDYLLSLGVDKRNIIVIDLTLLSNAKYRDPIYLYEHVMELVELNEGESYVFIYEIQEVYSIINPSLVKGKEHKKAKKGDSDVIGFVDVVLDLASKENIDLYVTGSNSKMLSSEVATEFRDKATNIRVQPLSFEEYHNYKKGDAYRDLYDFMMYGGMPLAVLKNGVDRENF